MKRLRPERGAGGQRRTSGAAERERATAMSRRERDRANGNAWGGAPSEVREVGPREQ
jgi:hypothetical protein